MNPSHFSGQHRLSAPVTSRRGFTLVELLVVVVIVAALAAISTVALRSMMRSADAAQCMANLKSISVAATVATVDNNGKYPAMRVFPWDPDGHLPDPGSGFYAEEKALSIGEVLGPHLGIEPESTLDIDPDEMPEVFQCAAAKRNSSMDWINRYGAYRFNYYAIGRRVPSGDAMLFQDTCWNDWAEEDFSHQDPAGLNVAYADGSIAFINYQEYMEVNPAGSEEKNNRLFTRGWLD